MSRATLARLATDIAAREHAIAKIDENRPHRRTVAQHNADAAARLRFVHELAGLRRERDAAERAAAAARGEKA